VAEFLEAISLPVSTPFYFGSHAAARTARAAAAAEGAGAVDGDAGAECRVDWPRQIAKDTSGGVGLKDDDYYVIAIAVQEIIRQQFCAM
jgi:hypothetical protein